MTPQPANPTESPTSRARRALMPVLLAIAFVLAMGGGQASAARTWCSRDPLFRVGNDIVDVTVSSYTDMLTSTTGPIQLVLTVPTGVSVQPYYIDSGFGKGYSITYATSSTLKDNSSSTQVSVAVNVPASDLTLPVKLVVRSTSGPKLINQTTATGTAGSWVTVKTK